ncbi:MAG: bifunctional folylpolyglutamate synthase/dihydrofolate synthase [Muribaculaceae bacterium]|nr:bifunctional folylpolyglutamate synthase/dihydrofolate synthase [Muribaculaceae bacterium]
MNYQETLEWLFAQLPMFSRTGAAAYKPGLERSIALAEHFDNPHKKLRCVHVAGTNGKGSVSSLIAATLTAQGYKTALYTSPHLTDFRERMRIDGKMIPESEVTDFVTRWQSGTYQGDKPSFFELTMMMAFNWFARENVDFAIIEVGMGGRLDSTNIITPLLSVITNISKDHTQFLGDTLAKIAAEKAGIIKPGIPAVIGEATAETEEVFRKRAAEVGAPLREAYRETNSEVIDSIECPLAGDYQKKNLNTARIAIDALRKLGIEISDDAMKRGFRDVEILSGLRGRWQIIKEEPLTICDTGHNEAGLTYNFAQLKRYIDNRRDGTLRMVIGFVADKDIDTILSLLPNFAVYYATQADIPRALPWETLVEKMQAQGLEVKGYPSVKSAIEQAGTDASDQDIIYIGGSTFVVADYLGLQS